jgi:hypothetical protein
MDVRAKITAVSYDADYFHRTQIHLQICERPSYLLLRELLIRCSEDVLVSILIEMTTMCVDNVTNCVVSVKQQDRVHLLQLENITGDALQRAAVVCAESHDRKSYYLHICHHREEVVVSKFVYDRNLMKRLDFS